MAGPPGRIRTPRNLRKEKPISNTNIDTRLVGLRELAGRVGLTYGTVRRYRSEGKMPDADLVLDGKPFWYASTVEDYRRHREQKATAQTD